MLQPNMVRLQNPKPCFHYGNLSSYQNSIITAPFTPRIHSLSLLTGRSTKSAKLVVKSRQADYYEQQEQRFSSSQPSTNHNRYSGGQAAPKVFVGHYIYKGKAALNVEPRAPEFVSLDSGAFKVSKEGFLLLQFAPAASVRQYDWSRKQVFSLSVAEIGTLISLGPTGSCEFFHDPNKGRSDEGKVRKLLKVEPLPDGSGHFFNLSVQNKIVNIEESIYIPVTRAEYSVLMTIFNYILPYLLGWNAFANSIKPDEAGNVNATNSRYGGDSEWNR